MAYKEPLKFFPLSDCRSPSPVPSLDGALDLLRRLTGEDLRRVGPELIG